MATGTSIGRPSPFNGLRLPDWGPYSKYYAGASRILHDPSHGMIDVIPVIGYVRGKLIIPDVSYDCGYHHWDALADLSYFSYRYELGWKDVEYVDSEFFAVDSACLLAKLTFVNNSPLDREYVCSMFAVHRVRPYVASTLAPGEVWLGAEGYARLVPAPGGPAPAPIRVDGVRQGIVMEPALVGGMGVGNALWREDSQFTAKDHQRDNRSFILGPGAELTFRLADQPGQVRHLHLRYALSGIAQATARLELDGATYPLVLEGIPQARALGYADLRWASVSLPAPQTPHEITLRIDSIEQTDESPALVVDGVLLSDEADARRVSERFIYHGDSPRFTAERAAGRRGVVLTSAVRPGVALALYSDDERAVPPPPYADATVTHVYHGDLSGDVQRKLCNDSLVNWDAFNCVVQGDGSNHFAGYNLAPIVCAAHSRREVYVAIAYGQPAEVRARAEEVYRTRADSEAEGRKRISADGYHLAATPHRLSQQLLMAQLCMNVTYPQYIENGWYIGHTPAKRWSDNALWDSGMHALGQAEYAPERALEIFQQFTTDANLSVWSVFPIHILAFWELQQRQPNRAQLEYFYPRFQHYYAYLMARAQGLHSAPGVTGLLVDGGGGAYGMDDYPAKWHAAGNGRKAHMASADTSAYAIRAAKTMRLMARALGTDDDRGYLDDIQRLSRALQSYSWNESSGYFSYVDLNTLSPVLYDDGSDYNMGLDGVSPLVAGICTPEQKQRLLEHLTREGELWTRYGVTAVAQNAPYYRSLGYWSGKVWVPYQWVFWKALLTEGQLEWAERIALTALELWRRETEASYNSWELFDARTGMGQGAHQFAGLSGPVAALYHAHYTPGHLSVGFDTVVHSSCYQAGERPSLLAQLSTPFSQGRTGLVAALGLPGVYSVSCDGESWQQHSTDGWLYVSLTLDETNRSVSITRC